MSEATQNNTAEVKQWYRDNHDSPPFNPDGMCLAVCRTARNIGPRYPSALSASQNTPVNHRIKKLDNIHGGMVAYFDDPNDSNPFGHITTVIGRTVDHPTSIGDFVMWTNSVVSGKLVVVRGDYFKTHWGDSFVFAADWLNGEPFYDLQPKPKPPPLRREKRLVAAIQSIEEGLPEMRRVIDANKDRPRMANALGRDLDRMIATRDHLRAILEKRGRK